MPPGIPVATVGVDGAKNAAYLAARILALKHPQITSEELNLIRAGRGPVADSSMQGMTKGELLRHPQTWGLLLARFISDPVWWFYLFWLPKYLVEQRGFELRTLSDEFVNISPFEDRGVANGDKAERADTLRSTGTSTDSYEN